MVEGDKKKKINCVLGANYKDTGREKRKGKGRGKQVFTDNSLSVMSCRLFLLTVFITCVILCCNYLCGFVITEPSAAPSAR